MQESIKKIIISLLIIIFIIIIYFLYANTLADSLKYKNRKGIGIDSRTIDINILDDKMFCEDEIVFKITSKQEINYKFFQDKEYLNNVKIKFKNDNNFYSSILKNALTYGSIILPEDWLDSISNNDNTVTINLEYELDKDYITRYIDRDVLSYYIDIEKVDYLNDLTVNLSSNDTISNLTVEDLTISKTRNKHIINMNNLEESLDINMLFNIDTNINNTINSKYIDKETLKEIEKYSYINERTDVLVACVVISVVLFILSFIINKKIKVNNYRRETSDLVSPILAEAIVDGRIGLKELIMTTIIELNIRGNIKIINNDIIELISLDNLEFYEKSIIELLFKNNNKIRFIDINNIFAKSNQETLRFTKQMNQIKELLLEKIYSMNIFSKGLTIINKAMALISILISINLPQIFLENAEWRLFFAISFFVTMYYIKKNVNKTTMQEEIINDNNKKRNNMVIPIILMLFVMIGTLIYVAKYHIVFLTIIILTFALNIYTAYRSQAIVLTGNGRKEQAKLIELKKYINGYSLMKDRDLKSVIIWDEYLAYATAFGISNKVTDTIYEGWYNLNLNLQVVEKILR